MFNILVADAMKDRTNAFRIVGKGQPFSLRLVNTLEDAIHELASPPSGGWDLLFTSVLFLNTPDHGLTGFIVAAHRDKKLRGVICHSPLHLSDFLKALASEHVPCAWFPYNNISPSTHTRRAIV